MDLKALTNLLKSGGGTTSPITALASTLAPKLAALSTSSDGSVIALSGTLTTLVTDAGNATNGILGKIQNLLPIAAASDRVLKKLEATQGQNLQGGMSASFTNTFAPITTSASSLTNIDNILTPTVVAQLVAGDMTAFATLAAAASQGNTDIGSSISLSTAAVADNASTLKNYAFAKFVSTDHPPPVQNIVNSVMGSTVVPYESVKADVSTASTALPAPARMPPAIKSPETPSTATETYQYQSGGAFNTRPEAVNLAAIGYTDPVNCQQQFKDAYFTYVEPLSKAADTYFRDTVSPASDAFTAWKNATYPNYADLKAAGTASGADPTAVAAYNNAKAGATASAQYQTYLSAVNTYTPMRDNIIRLRNQWHAWVLNKFATAHAGPPW